MTDPVNTYIINKLPVRACVSKNDDGSYSIFISAQLSYEEQIKAYKHEMFHILNRDFEKSDVQEIESFAHERR